MAGDRVMNYRLTCLTPTLAGDGRKLAPIDYMVWKDQVNVLDQNRIFRLLAKGPRLEGYLTQLRRAEKLDFASWGGFAQNFADRRIPFEHPALTGYWERLRGEHLFIPSFAAGPSGPYVPGTAIKGALHTSFLFARWTDGMLRDLASRMEGDRPPRRPAESAEETAIGPPGHSRLRPVAASDSAPVPPSVMKIYLLRTSTLVARGGGRFELGWKVSPRGSVEGKRPGDSTPVFCEMAAPGTVFTGSWRDSAFLARPDIAKALRWREPLTRAALFEAANNYAAQILKIQRRYAAAAGLAQLDGNLAGLEEQLARAREEGNACLLAIGWGSGFLTKVACLDTDAEPLRQVLRAVPLYSRAIQTGLPFPKTRKIVFLDDQPATLPGFVKLAVFP